MAVTQTRLYLQSGSNLQHFYSGNPNFLLGGIIIPSAEALWSDCGLFSPSVVPIELCLYVGHVGSHCAEDTPSVGVKRSTRRRLNDKCVILVDNVYEESNHACRLFVSVADK